MKFNYVVCSLSILFVVFSSGCKKYEDGPLFSLRSKEARVVNNWKYERIFDVKTGNNYTVYNYKLIEFFDNGRYHLGEGLSNTQWDGDWEFSKDKKEIILDKDEHYRILKLKEKEFWYRNHDGSTEYHLVPN